MEGNCVSSWNFQIYYFIFVQVIVVGYHLLVFGCKLNLKMGQRSFSANALIVGRAIFETLRL